MSYHGKEIDETLRTVTRTFRLTEPERDALAALIYRKAEKFNRFDYWLGLVDTSLVDGFLECPDSFVSDWLIERDSEHIASPREVEEARVSEVAKTVRERLEADDVSRDPFNLLPVWATR